MSTERTLRCPACDAPMQTVDRRGVVIDICRDCRGVYLDRGELDKLLDEAARQDPTLVASGTTPSEPTPLAAEADRLGGRRRPHRDDDDEYNERDEHGWERGRRRRRGWLDDIFDFD